MTSVTSTGSKQFWVVLLALFCLLAILSADLFALKDIVLSSDTKVMRFFSGGKFHRASRWSRSTRFIGVTRGLPVVIGKDSNGDIIAAYVPRGRQAPNASLTRIAPAGPLIGRIGREEFVAILVEAHRIYGLSAAKQLKEAAGGFYDEVMAVVQASKK